MSSADQRGGLDLEDARWLVHVLTERSFRIRRVEQISFESHLSITRRCSWTVDAARMREDCPAALASDRFPICFLPKRLHYGFDLKVGDKSVALVNHQFDVDLSVSLLITLGSDANGGVAPSALVAQLLRSMVESFPDEHDPVGNPTPNPARHVVELGIDKPQGARASSAGVEQPQFADPGDAQWWETACAYPGWAELAAELAGSYVLYAPLPDDADEAIVKTCVTEPIRQVPRLRRTLEESAQIDVHGTGHALSEHIRISAPDRMFFSGDWFSVTNRTYRRQESKSRLIYYSNDLPSSDVFVWATLSPEQRSFAAPTLTIAAVSIVVLGAGAIFDSVLKDLAGKSTALGAMALFLPSAAVAYLNRNDDHEIRWRSLRFVRRFAWIALTPLLLGFVVLTPPPKVWDAVGGENFIPLSWRILTAASVLVIGFVLRPIIRAIRSEKTKTNLEGVLVAQVGRPS